MHNVQGTPARVTYSFMVVVEQLLLSGIQDKVEQLPLAIYRTLLPYDVKRRGGEERKREQYTGPFYPAM